MLVRSTRHERLYLTDIVEAAEAIARFLERTTRAGFVSDDLLRSAVLNKLQIIGEAAAHVGPSTRGRIPQVPWRDVVGFRNFTVHAYFAVDWEVVWSTAVDDVPQIAAAVRPFLADGPS